jgi:hypothetical protein
MIGEQAFANCKELTDVYCWAEKVATMNGSSTVTNENVLKVESDIFQNSYIEYATLHVPVASINNYKTVEPWKNFKEIVALNGETPEVKKCATPTIAFVNGKLKFSCETEGVEYVYEIKDTDIKKGYDSEVTLSATYEISVYATKTGWEDSDMATATLIWSSATFTETTHEMTLVKTLTRELPTLVTSHRGTIKVQSEVEGLPIAVYSTDGQLHGSSIVSNGQATVSTNLQPGCIAIVKIGDKAVKVVVR